MASCAKRMFFVSGVFVIIIGTTAVRADDCKPLTLISSIDLTPLGNNQAMLAPVTINNSPKLLLVDTGGFASELTLRTVDDLHLSTRRVRLLQYGMSGTYSDQAARADTFVLGKIEAQNIDFMIANDTDIDSKNTDGAIGPSILKYYDVELDFPAKKNEPAFAGSLHGQGHLLAGKCGRGGSVSSGV